MTRPSVKQAFLLHFGISLIIFIALVAIMRMVWFPGDLFYMDGGLQGLKIIAPIDLVLGPVLTLCFYRPWKKSLKFDMATIAVVQIVALGYGVYTAYQQRPAAIVFAENRFETLSLNEYKLASEELRKNDIEPIELKTLSDSLPVVVHARAFSKEEYGQYLADIMNGMPELRERSDRFRPISEAWQEIAEYRITSPSDGTAIAESTDAGETVEIPASAGTESGKTDAGKVIEPEKTEEIYPLKASYGSGTIHFETNGFDWIDIRRSAK